MLAQAHAATRRPVVGTYVLLAAMTAHTARVHIWILDTDEHGCGAAGTRVAKGAFTPSHDVVEVKVVQRAAEPTHEPRVAVDTAVAVLFECARSRGRERQGREGHQGECRQLLHHRASPLHPVRTERFCTKRAGFECARGFRGHSFPRSPWRSLIWQKGFISPHYLTWPARTQSIRPPPSDLRASPKQLAGMERTWLLSPLSSGVRNPVDLRRRLYHLAPLCGSVASAATID
jgi:hypothetical protein